MFRSPLLAGVALSSRSAVAQVAATLDNLELKGPNVDPAKSTPDANHRNARGLLLRDGSFLAGQNVGIPDEATIRLWRDGKILTFTPNQVAATPMNFRPHYERVMDADLDFPIHLVAYRGRLVVLDGVHRLLKAHFLRRRWIEAKIATATQLQECTPS